MLVIYVGCWSKKCQPHFVCHKLKCQTQLSLETMDKPLNPHCTILFQTCRIVIMLNPKPMNSIGILSSPINLKGKLKKTYKYIYIYILLTLMLVSMILIACNVDKGSEAICCSPWSKRKYFFLFEVGKLICIFSWLYTPKSECLHRFIGHNLETLHDL